MKTKFNITTMLACIGLFAIGTHAHAQKFGELTVKFAKDGRTEKIVPKTMPENSVRTPKNGKPYLYVGWRSESSTTSSPDYKADVAMFNARQDDDKAFGLGLLMTRGRDNLHYASKCPPNTQPKCDPTAHGLRHDAAAKKIYFKDAVFDRVSMDRTDPKDVLIVNGVLSYAK
jgi:hypothetical protein